MTSVSVSPLERGSDGFNVVYIGTEPSEFYKSDDGGQSWERMVSLNSLSFFSIMELSSKTLDSSCALD